MGSDAGESSEKRELIGLLFSPAGQRLLKLGPCQIKTIRLQPPR
jgi:hypothetical protein